MVIVTFIGTATNVTLHADPGKFSSMKLGTAVAPSPSTEAFVKNSLQMVRLLSTTPLIYVAVCSLLALLPSMLSVAHMFVRMHTINI